MTDELPGGPAYTPDQLLRVHPDGPDQTGPLVDWEPMTSPEPVPPQAITDAEATLRAILGPWLEAKVHGTALDSQIPVAAACVLRDTAPHLEAAVRERCAQLAEQLGEPIAHAIGQGMITRRPPQGIAQDVITVIVSALLREGAEGGGT